MKCVQCGKTGMKTTTGVHEVRIGERSIRGVVPAMKCPECGETYIEGTDLQRLEFEAAEAVLRAGAVDGASFRFLRHTLGLQAKELADLLGTTPETISRWEKGKRDVDRAAWLALAMLVADRKDGRQRLRSIVDAAAGKPGKLPSTVKVAR